MRFIYLQYFSFGLSISTGNSGRTDGFLPRRLDFIWSLLNETIRWTDVFFEMQSLHCSNSLHRFLKVRHKDIKVDKVNLLHWHYSELSRSRTNKFWPVLWDIRIPFMLLLLYLYKTKILITLIWMPRY